MAGEQMKAFYPRRRVEKRSDDALTEDMEHHNLGVPSYCALLSIRAGNEQYATSTLATREINRTIPNAPIPHREHPDR